MSKKINGMRFAERCFLGGLLLLSLGSGLWALTGRQKGVSDDENRTLMIRDKISFDVAGGAFQDDLEKCLSDQYPERLHLLGAVRSLMALSGQKDIGGTYILSGGRLVQKITAEDVDTEAVSRYGAYLSRVCGKAGVPLVMIPVPSAEIALKDEMPSGAPVYDYAEVVGLLKEAAPDARIIDLSEALSKPEMYYRTDHHWTTDGANEAYRALFPGKAEEGTFASESVTKDFKGTLYSRALLPWSKPDEIRIVRTEGDIKVTADGKEGGLYDFDALEKKDKYQVFQGGNHGRVDITNGDAPEGTLLLLKDSFANSLVPLLANEYKRIIMIDERYGAFDLPTLIKDEGVDEVLVVREAAFFS